MRIPLLPGRTHTFITTLLHIHYLLQDPRRFGNKTGEKIHKDKTSARQPKATDHLRERVAVCPPSDWEVNVSTPGWVLPRVQLGPIASLLGTQHQGLDWKRVVVGGGGVCVGGVGRKREGGLDH